MLHRDQPRRDTTHSCRVNTDWFTPSHSRQEASELLVRAIELDPSSYGLKYTLLLCLKRLGKTQEAKIVEAKMAESAAEIKRMDKLVREVNQKPNDPALRYEAGMIFYNDEGTENGGLIFGGKKDDKKN